MKAGKELPRNLLEMAEADDLCEPQLLEKLLPFFEDPDVNLAYSQSNVIDEHGKSGGCEGLGVRCNRKQGVLVHRFGTSHLTDPVALRQQDLAILHDRHCEARNGPRLLSLRDVSVDCLDPRRLRLRRRRQEMPESQQYNGQKQEACTGAQLCGSNVGCHGW